MEQPMAQPDQVTDGQMAPGQITADQLKNMTPEQIKEMQKQNCIFCHIIKDTVQSRKIYEDDNVVAVLDINPANPGHILLLPKEHYSIMPQIKELEIGYMFMVAKAISNACLRALKCQGTNIFVANGVAAGQKAPHFMVHIIPRKDGDGLTSLNIPKKEISEGELDALQKKLKKAVDDLFGVEKKEPINLDAEEETPSLKDEQKKKEESNQEQEAKAEESGFDINKQIAQSIVDADFEEKETEKEEETEESVEDQKDEEKADSESTEKIDEQFADASEADETETEQDDKSDDDDEQDKEKADDEIDLDSIARVIGVGR